MTRPPVPDGLRKLGDGEPVAVGAEGGRLGLATFGDDRHRVGAGTFQAPDADDPVRVVARVTGR